MQWSCRQKDMSQWFIDITKYAQQLLDGLDTIEFPESVRLMQEDWLGRSEGAEIEFGIEGSEETIRVLQLVLTPLWRHVCHTRTRASTCGRVGQRNRVRGRLEGHARCLCQHERIRSNQEPQQKEGVSLGRFAFTH